MTNSNYSLLLTNCRIIDINHQTASKKTSVLLKNGKIEKIAEAITPAGNVRSLDLDGRCLLPGLIDNHVHLTAAQFNLVDTNLPETYVALQSEQYLKDALMRGFTSLRDAGGADYGLQLAIETGLIKGPRLFRSGKALSQTGGHGDFRSRNAAMGPCFCHCGGSSISLIADGISAVRKAVREQFRTGASQIKIMASGGIASPNDSIDHVQFSDEEICAIVEEAKNAGSYVMAHAYTPDAIRRCVKNGVRTIEHGNLLDKTVAKYMAEKGVFLVPTMVTYQAISEIGEQEGFPKGSLAKLDGILENALESIENAYSKGVKVGFGSDLLGPIAWQMQSREFILRAAGVETPHQIICAATHVNAQILQHDDLLGVVKEGAFADLIAVDGNPLDDISLLAGNGEHITLVIKAGEMVKNLVHPQAND